MAFVYPGSGARVTDSIATGVDVGVARHDLDAEVVVEVEARLEDRLRRLARQGVRLVVVGFPWGNPAVERAARDNPGTRYLAADYHGELPNVSMPTFAFEEGAFLVGAAAAMQSRTGIVGILVAADSDRDWPYPAGFAAGVRAVDPGMRVLVSYLPGAMVRSLPFGNVNAAAHALYRRGADVVFYAGQAAPLGALEAAYSESAALGRHCWAVVLDTDWYAVLPLVASGTGDDASAWRPHVLTSLITHYDEAFATMLDAYAEGTLAAGERRFHLADGVFELAESGGFIESSLPALAVIRERIVSGEIEVPALPDDRGPPR